MSDAEDRTEAPSEQRLRKAREDGQIAFSREAMSTASLFGGTISVFLALPFMLPDFMHSMTSLMQQAGTLPSASLTQSPEVKNALTTGLKLALIPACIALVTSVGTGLLQTGFLLSPSGIAPKFSRVSPLSGLKRLIGGHAITETLKTLGKLSIFGFIIFHEMRQTTPGLKAMVGLSLPNILPLLSRQAFHACLLMVSAQLVFSGADVFWTRYRHTAKLKMSREELKEEHRNSEGDPHVKGRLKALRARAAKERMKEAVENATVIITNPTHYAVALQYEKGAAGAPKIVAKGMDDVAARIREIAQDKRIPIVPNPPLARALHALPLESEVPAEHFRAVAAVISYVWRLKQPAHLSTPVR
ncbi:flagellar biosynthetic protein FlhB [Neokomagataea thailandica NBRC 106555]|uniref:EscU/YscU/HrcU family type III secretion system export apparatus switch protein n=2 Tax=Neokomagataea TaxID=1223423 RepID=A0A4Y6V4U6_9PROT|nr:MULTISPECIES: EscU/YscU/HrcU family type III secretion system export apparatus switch protein [Neokomagataea]QDH25079.1 EscU/YscU/HrcU family type III secretion system export apparatus switch protein [Neokomagataea tanensis]GBR54164.1 flagellar biosynthetic protein FlhB [Neokomagataea thailandica NBRC 106555]